LRTPLPELARHRDRVRDIVLAQFHAWEAPDQQYSFKIASQDDFFGLLHYKFFSECLFAFEPFTLHPTSQKSCFAYVQNNARWSSVWHDHLQTSTINGVYYLTAPDTEGQLWFMFRETLLKVTPEEGWLYLFPRWLLHKPVPQKSADYRISLNVELISNECPILRDGQARW